MGQFQFSEREPGEKLRVLFVGGIGQRKGIKYLLESIRNLNSQSIELQLLGPLPPDQSALNEWSSSIRRTTIEEAVAGHREQQPSATDHEIAALVAFLASEEAAFITGEIYRIDGGRMAKLSLPG